VVATLSSTFAVVVPPSRILGVAVALVLVAGAWVAGSWIWRALPETDAHPTKGTSAAAGSAPASKSAGADASALARDQVRSPAGPVLRLRVVDASGAPAPHAMVHVYCEGGFLGRWCTASAQRRQVPSLQPFAERRVAAMLNYCPRAPADHALANREAQRLSYDARAWLARFGSKAQAGANGCAEVPLPEIPAELTRRSIHVCASHGEDFGEAWILVADAAAREHVLTLARDLHFAIEVTDHRGAPAADMIVVARWIAHDPTFGADSIERQPLGITDDGGRARACHVQAWRARVAPKGGGARVMVGVDLPGLDAVGTEVDLDRLPAQAVQLRLPALGSLAVAVTGPLPANTRAEITPQLLAPGWPRASWHAVQVDGAGEGVYAHVALQQRWRVQLIPQRQVQTLAGPTREGERVVAHFHYVAPLAVVGRILHVGTPLAGAEFGWTACVDDERTASASKTDADGRLRITLPEAAPGARLVRLSLTYAPPPLGGNDAGVWTGATTPSITLRAPTTDVGDVVLHAAPVLLAGRVLGDGDRKDTHLEIAAGDVVELPQPHLTLTPEGEFTFHGAAPAGGLALVVTSPHHLPVAPIPFTAGQRELTVTLVRGATVSADFVVGEEIAFITLAPRLLPHDHRDRAELASRDGRGNDGVERDSFNRALPQPRGPATLSHDPVTFRYHWRGLPPGRYRLELLSYANQSLLADAVGIEVAAGAHVTVPPVDLASSVRHIRVGLRGIDADTQAERRGPLGYVFPWRGDTAPERGFAFDGIRAFVAVRAPIDLQLDIKGFRRQILRGVFAHVDVDLVPGIPVQVNVAAGAVGELLLDLTPETPPGTAFSPASGLVVAADMTQRLAAHGGGGFFTRVCAPGNYKLRARVRDSSGFVRACDVAPDAVRVLEAGASVTVRVTQR
jgi:hypothetical protein